MSAPIKAILALHAYGDVKPGTCASLLSEATTAAGVAWQVQFPCSDAMISRLRSALLTRAVESDADAIVWVDHDIIWDAGMLAGLVRRCVETDSTVGGLFPYRHEDATGTGWPWMPLPNLDPRRVVIGRDELLEVRYASGGFLSFSVPSLRRLLEAGVKSQDPDLYLTKCRSNPSGYWYDFCRPFPAPYPDGSGEMDGCQCYWSDDWAVQRKLHTIGVKTHIWLKPWLRHVGDKEHTACDALGVPWDGRPARDRYEAAMRQVAASLGDGS